MSPSRRVTATKDESAASAGHLSAVREVQKNLTAVSSPITGCPSLNPEQRKRVKGGIWLSAPHEALPRRDWRLHKHADYQRVYQSSRKQFASLLTYFVAAQPAEQGSLSPRIGVTAGKVLGKAVERNRIKRRMRAAIVANLDALHGNVDVVLHPKRSVLTAPWSDLRNELRRIFVKITEGQKPERTVDRQRSSEP